MSSGIKYLPVTVMRMPLYPTTEGTIDTIWTFGTTTNSMDGDNAVAPALAPAALNITTTAQGPPEGAFESATTTDTLLTGVHVWGEVALITPTQLPPCAEVAKLMPNTVTTPLGYTAVGSTLVMTGWANTVKPASETLDELPPAVSAISTRHAPAGVPAPTVKRIEVDVATTHAAALVPLIVAVQAPPLVTGTKLFPLTVILCDAYAVDGTNIGVIMGAGFMG